jgi:restriction system protein
MAVPMKKDLYRPILECAAQAQTKESLSYRQFEDFIYSKFSFTEADLQERTPRGATILQDHVYHAVQSLKSSKLLRKTGRGQNQITDAGREFLAANNGTNEQSQLPRPPSPYNCIGPEPDADVTPDELLAASYQQLQAKLADDLLEGIKGIMGISPYGFERLVVDLLVKMGYGKGEAVGGSGDGGIDGVINQDPLGLEKVFQAKRWANQVGEPEIRNFSGSLDARGASKGVFITTCNFSGTARQTAETISAGSKFIRLIDGEELARLMTEHGVGVVTEFTYELKKLDENYFSEFADL